MLFVAGPRILPYIQCAEGMRISFLVAPLPQAIVSGDGSTVLVSWSALDPIAFGVVV